MPVRNSIRAIGKCSVNQAAANFKRKTVSRASLHFFSLPTQWLLRDNTPIDASQQGVSEPLARNGFETRATGVLISARSVHVFARVKRARAKEMGMPFLAQCCFCNHQVEAPDRALGASGKCPKCGEHFTVVPVEKAAALPPRHAHRVKRVL